MNKRFLITRTIHGADGSLKMVRNETQCVAELLDEIAPDLPWETANALRILLTEEKPLFRMRDIKFSLQRQRYCGGLITSNVEEIEIAIYGARLAGGSDD